jgi:hypothetical protein
MRSESAMLIFLRNYILCICIFMYSPYVKASNRTLKQIIYQRANYILEQNYNGLLGINKGRKDLLLVMEKEPHQLEIDINRVSCIYIGNKKIIPNNKSAKSQFVNLGILLEEYVNKNLPALDNSGIAARLGVFWTSEIIYSLVQSFFGPVESAANKEEALLASQEWAALTGTSQIFVYFTVPNRDNNILIVSNKSKKTLVNIYNENEQKSYISENKVIFDLKTGEVKFDYRYELDGKSHEWSWHTFGHFDLEP